jgi:preprotein translocase subunit SecG
MSVVLTVLHVFVCIFLIAVVLLQRGKGAEIGAVFGSGASSTVFGGRGAGNFLTKLTTLSAVIYMVTSLSLSYLWTSASEERLFDEGLAQEAAEEDSLFEDFGAVTPESADDPGAGDAGVEETPEAPVEGIGIEEVPNPPDQP